MYQAKDWFPNDGEIDISNRNFKGRVRSINVLSYWTSPEGNAYSIVMRNIGGPKETGAHAIECHIYITKESHRANALQLQYLLLRYQQHASR
jgi:hypothetical protein